MRALGMAVTEDYGRFHQSPGKVVHLNLFCLWLICTFSSSCILAAANDLHQQERTVGDLSGTGA